MSNYVNFTSTLCYLTDLVFVLCMWVGKTLHNTIKYKALDKRERFRVTLSSLWTLQSLFALYAYGSSAHSYIGEQLKTAFLCLRRCSCQLDRVKFIGALLRSLSKLFCEIVVQIISMSLTSLSVADLSALHASTTMRYKWLRNLFRWFNGVFLGDICVPAVNVLQ